MRLTKFRVEKFRSILDSGWVDVDQWVTALVGKNEAGKSALLEALYLLSPAYSDNFDVDLQYPVWRKVSDRNSGPLEQQVPIRAEFALGSEQVALIESTLGVGALTEPKVILARKYDGQQLWTVGTDETKIVKHLRSAMPKSLERQLKPATLDALRAALDELPDTDDSTDLTDARQLLSLSGLDSGSPAEVVKKLLLPFVPVFFRFTSYSTLPGRINLADISADSTEPSLRTARALLKLSGADLNHLTDDDFDRRKNELEAVSIHLTNEVFEYWKQNPTLQVEIDVTQETQRNASGQNAVVKELDVRLKDTISRFSTNFSQRSSGFQWFFSFLAAFSEFENRGDATIILLDEPALTLHGRAQGDFLRFINERLAVKSQVLYTTHSPFLVEVDKLSRVRVVEDKGALNGGSVVHDEIFSGDRDSLFPLQAALGYDVAQSLFIGPDNLVVEGSSDLIYLTTLSAICGASGRSRLDDRWRILPAGSASKIPTFVSLIGHSLDVTVLADSATEGMGRLERAVAEGLLDRGRLVTVGEILGRSNADIEDLFTEGDYLDLFNRTFHEKFKVSDLPSGDRIVKRLESLRGEYVHGQVAEVLLRNPAANFADKTLAQFAALIDKINNTLS